MATADKYLQSWALWDYSDGSFFDSNGNPIMEIVKIYSRTYATSIAGVPVSTMFDPKTSHFELVFNANNSISEPTEIYLNEEFYYPNGFNVKIEPENSAAWSSPKQNYVFVTFTQNTNQGQQLTITIDSQ
jgi:endoglycosylceramidase